MGPYCTDSVAPWTPNPVKSKATLPLPSERILYNPYLFGSLTLDLKSQLGCLAKPELNATPLYMTS